MQHSVSFKKFSQLKIDIRACRRKNFSLKQVSGLKGEGGLPPDPSPASATEIKLSKHTRNVFFFPWTGCIFFLHLFCSRRGMPMLCVKTVLLCFVPEQGTQHVGKQWRIEGVGLKSYPLTLRKRPSLCLLVDQAGTWIQTYTCIPTSPVPFTPAFPWNVHILPHPL